MKCSIHLNVLNHYLLYENQKGRLWLYWVRHEIAENKGRAISYFMSKNVYVVKFCDMLVAPKYYKTVHKKPQQVY